MDLCVYVYSPVLISLSSYVSVHACFSLCLYIPYVRIHVYQFVYLFYSSLSYSFASLTIQSTFSQNSAVTVVPLKQVGKLRMPLRLRLGKQQLLEMAGI